MGSAIWVAFALADVLVHLYSSPGRAHLFGQSSWVGLVVHF